MIQEGISVTEIETLLTDLEAAKVGSRELDLRVYLALGYHKSGAGWQGMSASQLLCKDEHIIDWGHEDRPNPTVSVDDALALVPEADMWTITISWNPERDTHISAFSFYNRTELLKGYASATTPALALTIAILKARQGSGK